MKPKKKKQSLKLGAGPLKRRRVEVKLSSLQKLKQDVVDQCHQGLLEVFQEHTLVGCVDTTWALVQHKTKLFLLNLPSISQAYMYQRILREFNNLPKLKLSTPAPIRELLLIALSLPQAEYHPEDGDKETLATNVEALLHSKAPMLSEYFSIDIEQGHLHSLPQILRNYFPPLALLPLFLLRLGTECIWDSEVECFESVTKEISALYMIQPETDFYLHLYQKNEEKDEQKQKTSREKSINALKTIIEQSLFPTLRLSFIPPKHFAHDGTITQVASLENLYKIFERC